MARLVSGVGQRQIFGAVLLFGERHQALGQRLGRGVLLRVELRAEFLVDRDAVGIGDREYAGAAREYAAQVRAAAISHPEKI